MAGRKPEPDHTDPEAAFSAFRRTEVDPINREFWRLNKELILARAVRCSRDGDRVLDLGCGVGGYAQQLSQSGRRCVGIDPCLAASIRPARESQAAGGGDAEFLCGGAESLPFRDDSFDLVLCVSVLQHVEDQHATLEEIRRILRPGGRLIASVPQTIRRSSFRDLGIYTMHFNRRILLDLVRAHGFSVLSLDGSGLLMPVTTRICSMVHPILGEDGTRRSFGYLERIANRVPGLASSIIMTARVSK